MTIEALITERMWSDSSKLSTRILGYNMEDGFAFGIYRVQHGLTAQLRLGKNGDSAEYNVPLGPVHIENDRPFQLVITVREGIVSLYIDGFFLTDFPQTRKTTQGWKSGSLVIGDPEPVNADGWEAEVSGIAIYDRAFSADEVKENYFGVQQRVSQRERRKKVRLMGRLIEATPLPTPESIDAYRRALVDYTYEVVDVKSGIYRNSRIVVLHWAVLDGKPAPGVPRKVGQTYELLVEPAELHPQLRSERTESGTSEMDLPLYYDPTTPGIEPKTDD